MKEKIVYIAHPISNDIENNLQLVRAICRKIHSIDLIPIAPYIGSLSYLNNNNFLDRSFGIRVNQLFFENKFIDEVWLFGNYISSGMKQEIGWAHMYKIPVIPMSKAIQNIYTPLG